MVDAALMLIVWITSASVNQVTMAMEMTVGLVQIPRYSIMGNVMHIHNTGWLNEVKMAEDGISKCSSKTE